MATGALFGAIVHTVTLAINIIEKPVFAMFIIEEAMQATGMGIYVSMTNKQYLAASEALVPYCRMSRILKGVTIGTRKFYDVIGLDVRELLEKEQPTEEPEKDVPLWLYLLLSALGPTAIPYIAKISAGGKASLQLADLASSSIITKIMRLADKIFVEPFEAFEEGTRAQAKGYMDVLKAKAEQKYKTGPNKGKFIIEAVEHRRQIMINIGKCHRILTGPPLAEWDILESESGKFHTDIYATKEDHTT